MFGVVVVLGAVVLGVVVPVVVVLWVAVVLGVVVMGVVAVVFGVLCTDCVDMAWVGTTLIAVPNMVVWENPVGTCLAGGTCMVDIVAMVV